MATAPNNINFGTLIAPDVASEQMALARRQQMIDLLRQQSITPIEQQTAGGMAVPISPLQGIAKMATGYLVGQRQKDIDAKTLDLNREMAQRYAQVLSGGAPASAAAPAALTQGAAQGSVGPTVANAQRMDTMTAPQGGQGGFNMGNALRAGLIGQFSEPMASAYADQFKLPEGVKTNNYYGLSQGDVADSMRRTLAATGQLQARIGSTITRTNPDGSISPLFTAPDTRSGAMVTWENGRPVANAIPGLADIEGNLARAKAAGEGSVFPFAGVDGSGNPLPVTNRTAAATQGMPAPVAPMPAGPMPAAGNPPPGSGVVPPQSPQDRMGILQTQLTKTQQGIADPSVNDADRLRLQNDARDIQAEMARMGTSNGKPNGLTPPAAAPGAVYAAPPLGQTPYSDKLGTDAANRASATRSLASDSPTRVNVYDNILNLSRQGVNTGPGAEWQAKVKGYVANAPFLSSVTPDKWKDDVSGFQELNKFLYQNAQRNWQAAGGTGTDSQLEAFSHSSPNDKMFPQALQAMAQWGKGGELAVQGKARAQDSWLQQNGDNPKQQQAFENAWRSNFEPQLFQLRAMDPQAQQAFIDNLKKTNPSGYTAMINKAQTLKSMGAL